MQPPNHSIHLTSKQQRVLKLLFKFRFVTGTSLAPILETHQASTYKLLERITTLNLATKVYEKHYRIDRKPAHYFLNKAGVTFVRGLMEVKEPDVHALYKNDVASSEFVAHCLDVLACYPAIKQQLPDESSLFAKTELHRFKQFPKNRPDLYVRTPEHREAMIYFMHDSAPFITRKRLDEIVTHCEDGGWHGEYPQIAFVLKDAKSKFAFLYSTAKRLEGLGMDESEVRVVATTIEAAASGSYDIWSSVSAPHRFTTLF